MAEQLINEFTVNRPIDEAWTIITDVERIAPCLPGAELQEIEGETYRGVVKVKLGAISSQFKGEANFLERDDASHRAVIKGVGRDTGGRGNASAEITAQAESLSPTSTKVVVTTDLHITGKVAQFGRGIMGDVSSKLMAQFANNLNEMLDEQGLETAATLDQDADAPAASPSAAPSPTGAATTGATTTGATTTDAATTGGVTADGGTPSAGGTTSQVRKIHGPATEPIDLMEVGGSSILKRAIPAAIAVLLVLLVLRRRRG